VAGVCPGRDVGAGREAAAAGSRMASGPHVLPGGSVRTATTPLNDESGAEGGSLYLLLLYFYFYMFIFCLSGHRLFIGCSGGGGAFGSRWWGGRRSQDIALDVLMLSAAASACEDCQQCQRTWRLARATQYSYIVQVGFTHSAAISARDRASSAGRPGVPYERCYPMTSRRR